MLQNELVNRVGVCQTPSQMKKIVEILILGRSIHRLPCWMWYDQQAMSRTRVHQTRHFPGMIFLVGSPLERVSNQKLPGNMLFHCEKEVLATPTLA